MFEVPVEACKSIQASTPSLPLGYDEIASARIPKEEYRNQENTELN